ncbi:glycosyltransferase family 2 protein [Roseivivax sediminis]|uniref:Glycosyl transferase family 2 n=1 Tax=Roseivivax sediminis TaxID=936889 RepID=A0A1I1X0Q8_9RHOB|nr:glycosyltransferase family 2 protein [Roseivivax sediminis]SFE00919.1 Glycosyl transferase family 2 [Roseivivax sediminis]
MPRFSIVIPAFNADNTLADTLDSLEHQTLTDWEALIVDDGSTDATRVIAEAAAGRDRRIRVIDNPAKGPSAARNLALTETTGEIIAFLDADDVWAPRKLEIMAQIFRNAGIDAAFSRIAFFDEAGTRTVSSLPGGHVTVPMLLGENPVCTMSNLAVRRAAFAATGGFDTRLVHNEDLEWLIRLVATGNRLVPVAETLVYYRTSPTGLSADLAAMSRGREAAVATALRHGFRTSARAEAIHLRYLARRALRTDAPPRETLRLALAGAWTSPAGFFSDLRRGVMTLAGALAAQILPRRTRRALFSH